MSNVKVAVIGVGHLGRIHARLAKNLENATLVGVADPMAPARQQLSEELGVPGFADYRELIGKVDAAVVATPTRMHFDVASTLLKAGVHVLVEKPIASTVEEADEMVRLADKHGCVLQVGHVEQFNPALERVRTKLVEPKYIDAVRMSSYPFRSTDVGVVLDLMIHDLDLALAFVGSAPVKVEALGATVLGGHEDVAQARVTFASGCVANFTASRVSYETKRAMQVWSAGSFASIDFGMRSSTIVEPRVDVLDRQFDVDSLDAETRNHLKGHLFEEVLKKTTHEGAEGNAIAAEQRDLVDCIRLGGSPRVTGQQGRDVLALAEQVLESIRMHAWDGVSHGRVGHKAAPAVAKIEHRRAA